MNSVFYKVNGKGEYKQYVSGTYTKASKAFHELIARATAKGFQKVRHSFGCSGVNLTYSDGKTKVDQQECKSAASAHFVRESPDVSEADCGAYGSKKKS